MDKKKMSADTELEAGKTPEAMAGSASFHVEGRESVQKKIQSKDGKIPQSEDSADELENSVDDSRNIIAH